MIELTLPLHYPEKLFGPVTDFLQDVVNGLVRERVVPEHDAQKASDGAVALLPELLTFNLRMSDKDGVQRAFVLIRIQDDDAARTMLRQAAIEAVRFPR